jgi:hypothetical protein
VGLEWSGAALIRLGSNAVFRLVIHAALVGAAPEDENREAAPGDVVLLWCSEPVD